MAHTVKTTRTSTATYQPDYDVRVVETRLVDGKHETTCACTCGWSLTTTAADAQFAQRAVERARDLHLADAHPSMPSSLADRESARALAKSMAARQRTRGHGRTLSIATKGDDAWTRTLTCACGWTEDVTGPTPDRAAHQAFVRHRDHVRLETNRPPVRDFVLMLFLLAVVGTIVYVMADVAIEVSTRSASVSPPFSPSSSTQD